MRITPSDPTIQGLLNQIYEIHEAIHFLQEACLHPNLQKVPKADTGNWCKADDSWWYEFTCPTCGKFWTEPQ